MSELVPINAIPFRDVRYNVLYKIAIKFEQCNSSEWKLLADYCGFDNDTIDSIQSNSRHGGDGPTLGVFTRWKQMCPRVTIGDFIEICKKLQRNDVIELLGKCYEEQELVHNNVTQVANCGTAPPNTNDRGQNNNVPYYPPMTHVNNLSANLCPIYNGMQSPHREPATRTTRPTYTPYEQAQLQPCRQQSQLVQTDFNQNIDRHKNQTGHIDQHHKTQTVTKWNGNYLWDGRERSNDNPDVFTYQPTLEIRQLPNSPGRSTAGGMPLTSGSKNPSTPLKQVQHCGPQRRFEGPYCNDSKSEYSDKGKSNISIFLTYASDQIGRKHVGKVFENFHLAGFQVTLDMTKKEFLKKAVDKIGWLDYNFKRCDYILVCCSPAYIDEASLDVVPSNLNSHRLNTRYIDIQMKSEYYHNGSKNYRFIPIVMPGASDQHVPHWLHNTIIYHWPRDFPKIRERFIATVQPIKPQKMGPPPKIIQKII